MSDGSYAFTWPQFLPGDQSLLFAISEGQQLSRDGDIGLLSLDSGEYRTLIKGAYHPKYSPTGHIVFARNDTLWAVPFDAETNQITGDEAPLFDGVQHQSRLGAFAYDFSGDGLLVYLQGSDKYTGGSGSRAPLWLDRNGNEVRLNISLEQYWGARISPDGNQAAVVISDCENDDIWIIDLEREILSKLTFGAEFNGFPVWSPDGERIIYTSGDEEPGIYARAANGTGQPDLISKNDTAQYVDGISPDGEHLIVLSESSDNSDMYLLSLSGESFPQHFVTTPYNEDQADISPNGNFVAYRSDETGQYEVYVRTFPDPDGGRWQVSADGGRAPLWSHDGKELFFRTLDTAGGGFNVVDVETQAGFSFDNRRLLFSGTFAGGASNYDVSANSERFLAFRNQAQLQENSQNTSADATLTIVENWFEELKQITPAEPAD